MPERLNMQRAMAPGYSDDCYLLLDGLAMDVPVTAFSLDERPKIEPLFRGTRHAEVIEASPWLVKPMAGGQLLSSPEVWQRHGVVLYSAAGKDTLAQHLRSLISVRLPSQQLAYCRFYAPDWTARLFNSMHPEEFQAWSGPISKWLIHSDDSWTAYICDSTGQPKDVNDEGWYMLREEQLAQWQAEEQQRFIDRAMHYLGCKSYRADFAVQRERITRLIQQAQSYGFTLEHQALQYLELAWRFPHELSAQQWTGYLADHSHTADQRLQFAEQQLFGLSKDV